MAESKETAVAKQHETRAEHKGLRTRSADPDEYNPFRLMRRMSEEMDRAFGNFFGDFGLGRRSLMPRAFGDITESFWSPRVEAFQQGDRFVVRAELPGLKKEDVQVDLNEDSLTIQGQRRHEHEEQREGFYHSERSYGSFYRTIPLPEGVITDSAEASFRDGLLEVKLQSPPHEVSRGRRLEIKDASATERKK